MTQKRSVIQYPNEFKEQVAWVFEQVCHIVEALNPNMPSLERVLCAISASQSAPLKVTRTKSGEQPWVLIELLDDRNLIICLINSNSQCCK